MSEALTSNVGKSVSYRDSVGITHEGVIVAEDELHCYVRSTHPAFEGDGEEWHFKIARAAVKRYVAEDGSET
jgi:hypothetical protein